MRLNGIMALIAVVCVAGVMRGEILGPMAKLRSSRIEEAGGNEGGREFRAALADDLFQFQPSDDLADELVFLGPSPTGSRRQRLLPDPVTLPLAPLFGQDGDQNHWRDAGPGVYPMSALGGPAGPVALSQADFTRSTGPTTFSSEFSTSDQGPSFVNGGGGGGGGGGGDGDGGGSTQPTTVPEPASWLMLMLGIGGVGLALRRVGGRTAGLNDCAPDNLRS